MFVGDTLLRAITDVVFIVRLIYDLMSSIVAHR